MQNFHQQMGDTYGGHWPSNSPAHGGAAQQPGGSTRRATWNALARQYAAQLQAERDAWIAKQKPIPYAGIRAGEITAWRCWFVVNGYLKSTIMDTIWAPGEPLEGDVGEGGHGRGVHAWKTLSGALTYGVEGFYGDIAIGAVDLFGEVVEHEHGYRAQYAKVASVYDLLLGSESRNKVVKFGRWPFRRRETVEERRAKMLAALRERYGLSEEEAEK